MPDHASANSRHDAAHDPADATTGVGADDASHDGGDGVRAFDAPVAPVATHRVRFTRGALAPANPTLIELLATDPDARTRRMVVVADAGFIAANPSFEADLRAYAAAHPARFPSIVAFETAPGGEAAKESMAVADRVN